MRSRRACCLEYEQRSWIGKGSSASSGAKLGGGYAIEWTYRAIRRTMSFVIDCSRRCLPTRLKATRECRVYEATVKPSSPAANRPSMAGIRTSGGNRRDCSFAHQRCTIDG